MPEELREIYHEYQRGKISRRDFISKAVLVTGSLAAANNLLTGASASDAEAATVSPGDPDILTHNVEFKGNAGPVFGYLARPVKPGKYPAIIVIHENQGLTDHIRDVTRRLAKEGYVALAPDFLSRQGGTAKANPKGGGISNIRETTPWQNVAEDTAAGFAYLNVLPDVRRDKTGIVGFCWGGEMTFAAATQIATLDAAVVYYGRSPNPELIKNIKAPVMAHYGEKDPGVNKSIPETVDAMKKYNKMYDHRIYPGAQHAFNNDTNPARFDAGAAKEAWSRTLDFFQKHLKT
jgi:carboxymethylenebutenolidase